MVTTFTRGLLMLSQDMAMVVPPATLTEAPRVCMDIMVVMDTMVVPALMSTRPVLTTMDLMAMVSTTMARGLLMLDILDMEVMVMDTDMVMVAAATSM